MRTLLKIAAGLLIMTQSAKAADDVDCDTALSTQDLNACSQKEYEAADAKLNKVYAKVMAKIAASDGEAPYDAKSWEKAARAAQRAWVDFRDADCKGPIAMEWGGGTGTSAAVLGCLTSKTKIRTQELEERLEN